jgi:ABC-2 type transport system permease protein
MNTQSNTMNSTPVAGQAVAPSDIPAIRQFYISVQRELWENRSIYIAPLAVAVLFLLGFLFSSIHQTLALSSRSSSQLNNYIRTIAQPYDLVAGLIMAATFFVAIFYCLDALYGERRDRSILFWKSLPVSDTTTVLSKMAVPVVVVPLIAFALTVGVHLIMLLLTSAILQVSGIGAATLWTYVPLFHTWAVSFVHLVAGHGLAFAPFYAWLLLVSAWARRTPFLWAVLPPLAIAGVEKIAFNTSYFVGILMTPMAGGLRSSEPASTMSMDAMTPALGDLLSSPGLWIGFAVAAVFLVGAIRLRRARGPI